MNAGGQLQYEASTRMRYAVIAFLAAILTVGSQLIQLSGVHTTVDELTLDLVTAHRRVPIDQIGAAVDALGLLALMATLIWLHGIARARVPAIRDWIRWLVIIGGILSSTLAVVYSIVIAVKANQFVSSGNQGYTEAHALTSGGLIEVIPLLAELGSLLLAAGFIWTSLNALRVGLLTRPLGYGGVLAGALVLFPVGGFVSFIQGFWLVAASIMFAGRWVNGNPPAWETGIAVPWQPGGQARGGARAGGRGAPAPRSRRARLGEIQAQAGRSTSATTVAEDDESSVRTRANTPKRKRKRRT